MSTVDQETDLPRATLDTPNERAALERLWISIFGNMMQGSFFLLTLVADIGKGRDRISTTIYTGRTGKCNLLIYLPKEDAPRRDHGTGVVVHLHGSGWTVGKAQFEHRAARRMADELGTIVVCPNYHKAPGYPYPFALYEMHAVLDWIASGGLSAVVKTHRESFVVDTTRIALSGGSAGGNLAACLALLTQKKPLCNNSSVVALGLLYPHVDAATPFEEKLDAMDNKKDVALPPWVSKFFLKAYLPPPRNFADPYVSPLRASPERLALFPETVLVTASKDYLAREGDQFAEKLQKAGVSVRHIQCQGVAHAFDLDPAFSKSQRQRNQAATEESWGTIIDVFRGALSAS
ncbi:hypothetical protein EXIGLDRAFT_781185 [Exidia glandulosa HHB12029]|uniref:Alpha/beta hydrolase fold-3 domain-containing protein n=1 Tax=Exidia glandulosa HHB12029 TaxID=1314781 RepID=A0A165BBL9_EXIGL|nr:hypothetical protein EXIGLDRAFT_781185 [Exidia glandulosa HHB12029]